MRREFLFSEVSESSTYPVSQSNFATFTTMFARFRVAFIYALVEGVGIAAFELTFGKIITGFYGSTSEIWSIVLGQTMLFLAVGYYLGGKRSLDKELSKLPAKLVGLGLTFFLLGLLLAQGVMQAMFAVGFFPGAVLSAMLLMGPGLVCFSMINPVLIQLVGKDQEKTGNYTGRVFAISSVSGVLMALLVGYVLLPFYGKSIAVIVVCALILILTLAVESRRIIENKVLLITSAVSLVLGGWAFIRTVEVEEYIHHKIVYKSDGLLGENVVIDHYHDRPYRELVVNNIPQSAVYMDSFTSLGIYVHRVSMTASMKPAGSDALIVGMGGGSLVDEFQRLGFNIDVVDVDKRMFDIAEEQFNVSLDGVTCFEDDVRHFIRTTGKKYDLVVFDLSLAELQPSHVYTKEGFEDLKNLLKDDQSFVLIHYLDWSPEKAASRSIARTMDAANYQVRALSLHPNFPQVVIMVAMTGQPDATKFQYGRYNQCCMEFGPPEMMMQTEEIAFGETEVLTDDKPLLDVLNREMVKGARKSMLENYIKHLNSD